VGGHVSPSLSRFLFSFTGPGWFENVQKHSVARYPGVPFLDASDTSGRCNLGQKMAYLSIPPTTKVQVSRQCQNTVRVPNKWYAGGK
jgi:hypothetical protein